VTLLSLDGTLLAGQLYEAVSRPAPGVVLIHMLSRSKADWDDLAEDLADTGITALAIDLRGHGASGGAPGPLTDRVQDVRAAAQWLAARPSIRPDALGLVGASLGANLALLAAVDAPVVRVVASVSPSLDYRGVLIGPDVMRKLGNRAVWLAASTEDPFSLRTLKDLTAAPEAPRQQQLSTVAAHGTNLLMADPALARGLVDWLRQRLLF
jgi:alpha-beta hydrolase superfamily lysophospholipase